MSGQLISSINFYFLKGELPKQMVDLPSDGDASDVQSNDNDNVDINESFHLNNQSNDEESSDSEIHFQPNTSPFLQPIDSKNDVYLLDANQQQCNEIIDTNNSSNPNESMRSYTADKPSFDDSHGSNSEPQKMVEKNINELCINDVNAIPGLYYLYI